MFTGIIETIGRVKTIRDVQSNKEFVIESPLSNQFKVDQSISHDGVCLTVVKVEGDRHTVVAVQETLLKSNLGNLQVGSSVNLERCMLNNGRFDGHIVQGHVDQIGYVDSVRENDGSWIFRFSYDSAMGNVTVEKGSVSINGVSLTCFDSTENGFTVAIIPYTYEYTGFKTLRAGDVVNLEFDIIGKYVKRLLGR